MQKVKNALLHDSKNPTLLNIIGFTKTSIVPFLKVQQQLSPNMTSMLHRLLEKNQERVQDYIFSEENANDISDDLFFAMLGIQDRLRDAVLYLQSGNTTQLPTLFY